MLERDICRLQGQAASFSLSLRCALRNSQRRPSREREKEITRVIKHFFLIANLKRGRDVEELTLIGLTIIRLNVAKHSAFSPSAGINAMMNVGV